MLRVPPRYALTGEGEFPFDTMFASLAAIGFDGFVSFEWEKHWHPELAAPEIALPHFIKWWKSREDCLVFNAVRTLMPSDVPSAMELSIAANWNQTPEDWHRIMHLSAEGCRCIEDAGKIVATATLLPYGTRLAWIGMVLTRPEYRRQGLARRLMEDVIAIAERRGIHTLKLDATDEGRPLYENLGFVVEKTVERWGRDGEGIDSCEGRRGSQYCRKARSLWQLTYLMSLFDLDTEAFGVSRKVLLESLSHSGSSNATSNGYVFSRPGRTARYLGPCVANSEAEARLLIAAHLEDSANMREEQ